MLEDGLEVHEEVITPEITRFFASTKHTSPNTLTEDMRKLSLADQSDIIALEECFTYDEQQEVGPGDFLRKVPKSNLIYHKGGQLSRHQNSKSHDQYWANNLCNRTIDDDEFVNEKINQNCNDDDHLTSGGQYVQDVSQNDNIDGSCDDLSVNHEVKFDYGNFNDDDVIDSNNDVIDNNDDITNITDYIDIDHKKSEKSAAIYQAVAKQMKNTTSIKGNSDSCITAQHANESNTKTDDAESCLDDFKKPEQNNNKLETLELDGKTTNKFQAGYRECDLEHSNVDEETQCVSVSSDSSTSLSVNRHGPDHDSIQVKDIWKALVDGGYDISREEISKYKVNSKKTRIWSAPARRISSHHTNIRDVPTRAKSAVSRVKETMSKNEGLRSLQGNADGAQTENIGGLMQTQPLESQVGLLK